MREEENVALAKYTSFKMGGCAKHLYTPDNVSELKEIFLHIPKPYYCIGGGSNILINDNREFENVVNLREFATSINFENGIWKVGASVRLQTLINEINKRGYGGIEYLYSVPGLVGGAVYMNAGRGKQYHRQISDYIMSVIILKDGEIITLNKEQCCFEYRSSIFQTEEWLILEILFQFPEMELWESDRLKKERIELCKKTQDNSNPNFGTVFCQSNKMIMTIFKKTFLGRKGKVRYSTKTLNWMLNCDKTGTYKDAIILIERVKKLHKLLGKDCKLEVVIWN